MRRSEQGLINTPTRPLNMNQQFLWQSQWLQRDCVYSVNAIYRLFFALAAFFAAMSLIMIDVQSSLDCRAGKPSVLFTHWLSTFQAPIQSTSRPSKSAITPNSHHLPQVYRTDFGFSSWLPSSESQWERSSYQHNSTSTGCIFVSLHRSFISSFRFALNETITTFF